MQMPEIPENVKENKNVLFIGILYLCILGLWILSVPIISSSISIIILLSILQFYSLFSIYAKEKNTQENFYFETSPNIKKCEEERVSLEQPPRVRSPGCCKVTERGGKLPFIEDWKRNGWARTDNFVTNPDTIAYQTQLPPTTLVSL